jgi:hypothetical protein
VLTGSTLADLSQHRTAFLFINNKGGAEQTTAHLQSTASSNQQQQGKVTR